MEALEEIKKLIKNIEENQELVMCESEALNIIEYKYIKENIENINKLLGL